MPLSPGLYRLDIVMKDVNNGNVGVVNTRLAVPRFEDDHLSSSSLILADQITPVSSKDIGLGQFVLGDVKVRPKLDASFAAADGMGVFLQVYNLKVDDKTHKSDATVQYRVMKDKTTEPVLKFDIPKDKLPEHGEELTLENIITLGSLPPGAYKLEVAVTDNLNEANDYSGDGFYGEAQAPERLHTRGDLVSLRMIRSSVFGVLLCLLALPAMAAPNSGKISGVVLDSSGTPQMGATIFVTSDQLLHYLLSELLTNDRGRFSTALLPSGTYSIKVTLAGFLPVIEQHISGERRAHHSARNRPGIGIFFTGKTAKPARSASKRGRVDLGASKCGRYATSPALARRRCDPRRSAWLSLKLRKSQAGRCSSN